jgi:hypothetical protein
MSEKRVFEVLARSVDRRSRTLEPGVRYDLSEFSQAIVDEWVRTGFAVWADEVSKSTAAKKAKEK